jgi:fibro-slime domain-containing protein/LPXTG-motif cell wall-anchored protein
MKKALHRRLKKGISIVAACAIMATNFSPWLATAYAGEMPEEALYEGADEFYEAAPAVTETPEETQALSAASAEASYEVSAEPTETPDAAEPTEALATAEATEAPDENGIAEGVEVPDDVADEDAFDEEVETPDGQILENAPSVIFEQSTDEVRVTVVAGVGVFPEGTTMEVVPAEDEETISKVSETVEDEKTKVTGVKAVEVTFYNAEHEEIEPSGPVFVTLEDLTKIKEEGAQEAKEEETDEAQITEEAKAVHVTDEGECALMASASGEDIQNLPMEWEEDQAKESVKKIEELSEEATVAFIAETFSTYALVYTVDFEYSVNGQMYQFSLPGGEKIALSDLVEVLGIIGDTNNGEKAAFNSVDVFLKEVANIEFSDESLVKVTKNEEGNDWTLESLQPFTSEETLTITMKNGDVITVKVTDAQIKKTVISASGEAYEITVTYGEEAGIPEGAELEVNEILPDENGDASASSAYDEYVSKTENALGMEEGSAGYIRLFDIKIVDKDDHEIKYQPKEGTTVDVRIELADSESESLSVVHFADGAEEGDKVESSTESVDGWQAVSFEASGFSVYGIVDLDSAETAASVDGLDGNSYYLSVDNGSNRYYFTNALNSVPRIVKTTTIDSAARYYFEATDPDEQGNSFYIYTYDDNGNKKYANMTIASNKGVFSFDEEATTKYIVDIYTEGTEETPATFHIYNRTAANVYYTWHFNTDFEVARNSKGNGDKIILTKIGDNETAPSDPYGLDGQSLGIIWNTNDTSGSGMLSSAGTSSVTVTLTDEDGNIIKDENNKNVTVKETINVLKNKSTTVRIDPVSRTNRVFVAQNSDITMWTFACCGPAQYYITAVVNGQLKYVRFDDTDNHGNSDKGISLVDTPDERCKITVTEGTGTYSGKYKLSSNGRTLYNNNGNFYTVLDSQNGSNVWMYFAEQSNLNDDDFVVYTAKKVSVSGPVNEDGTIDYDVKDGDQVVLYTRIWNETTLEYEYYAIDYDGMLVRAYMSGDNISWVGSKVNTMLWDFTEYHYLDDDGNETDIPNYYYELQNNYSGKYIAPQVTGNEFLADSPIGINLNGRRYNEYYSTILAWDDPYYDYAMLMVPENEYQLGSAPIALANDTTLTKDFYFAIMTNDEESGELSTVETIDHTSFGISVKMINYPGGLQSTAGGNYHNMIQTNVLGQTNKSGSTVYADLLKKNLSKNGYPDVAYSGYTDHNLSELYADCQDLTDNAVEETTVNHTFLASTYSETGYFEYDCTQNFAHLITSEDDVWYGMPMPGGGTYGIGDFVIYDQLGTTSETGDTRRHGQYFPYNDLAKTVEEDEDGNLVITPAYSYSTTMYNTTNIKGQAITSLDPRYGEQLYQIPNNNTNKLAPNVDHYFGMEMDASFMQSESGLDAWGHDLIFEFSGDDDFWLYVDGMLVLDLGGIHSACDGSVNFRTGEVNVNGTKTTLRALYRAAYLEEHPDATDDEITAYLDGFFRDGGTVFKDFSGHTMKMFYMERGAGASNLHMRFNLAPYVNDEVQLEKEVSGTDTVSTQFPFQIWYEDKISGQFVQVGSAGHDLSVLDANTGDPISHEDTYTINGATYNYVYFLSPGQTASIQLPSEDTKYYFVECGINPNTYDQVTANGETIEGITVSDSDTLKDYKIEIDTVSSRKKVIYNNHVSDNALKTLTVTKRLWKDYEKTDELYSGDGADADNTNFRFRIYIGSGTDKTVGGTSYAVYNTGKYYVKNSAGEYCIWQNGGFVSTGKTYFSDLSTQRTEGEWKSEAEQATFYTSPGGAVDNIKAGYSIEIPGLMAGTPYYIEERSDEIPAGYNLIDYTTTEGAYSSGNTGTEGNSGTIAANDSNRTVSVHNQHGYGLVVDKVWSDAAFMESHDDIYFGVYLDGTLVEDSVRRLHHPATSINWFFRELEEGKTLNDYQVYELELTKNGQSISADDITIDPDTGKVTWDPSSNISVTKKEANDSIDIGGVSNEYGYSVSYSYTVGYERQELSAQEIADKVNSRTDTVSNSRPGIKFMKTDLSGSPLSGAKFVLTDDSGTIRKTFSSAEDGLIVVSYLENDKTYTLTETAAPYGYQTLISSITIKKTVNTDGKTVVYVNGEVVNGSVKDETNTYELYTVTQVDEPTADNMPTITIRNKDYTLKAVKVDAYSYEPMKDVKFALYKEVYETVNGVPDPDYPMPDYNPMSGYDNLTTDENGVIPGIFMKNSETPGGLTAGTYYLREETPSGYNSLGFDIRITISDTGEVTLQSATRPTQSGHWTFGTVSSDVANVAYKDGVMQITVTNTPKDPVRIKKLEMGTENKVLEGVQFKLYRIGQIDDDGLPREDESDVISGATDENGILLLGGLEENTSYYLYETEALPGYNMLTAPVIITTSGPNTIYASLNGAPLGCQKVKDSNNNDVWEITVYNSTGYELPSTGGPGTNLIYLIGIMLTGIAGASLVMRKRRRDAA